MWLFRIFSTNGTKIMSHCVILSWFLQTFHPKSCFREAQNIFFCFSRKFDNTSFASRVISLANRRQEAGGWLVNTLIVNMHILMNFPHYTEKLQPHCTSPHR